MGKYIFVVSDSKFFKVEISYEIESRKEKHFGIQYILSKRKKEIVSAAKMAIFVIVGL